VLPALTLALLVICRSALGLTVKVAVTVVALAPTVVVNEPAGILFAPVAIAVTTADTEQEAPGGTTVVVLTDKEFAPATAVTDEFAHVVVASGADELLICAG